MPIAGFGCDCYQQDTDGNCLDPQPCPGDSASGTFGTSPLAQAQGLVYTDPTSLVGPLTVTPTVSSVASTTATVTPVATACTQTIVTSIAGFCDTYVYLIGAAIIAWALMGGSGSHRR